MKQIIKITAPASWGEISDTQRNNITALLNANNMTVSWSQHVSDIDTLWGASDKKRLSDLMNAFQKNTPIILAFRGGYGSARLLPMIDWSILKKSSSLFVGFSDLTSFQNAYYAKTQKPSITGMLATFIKSKPEECVWTSFLKVLNGESIDFKGLPHITSGKTSGILIGGNLTCFESLIGTPYMPHLKGKILLLEEVCEAPYRIDRMLTHLKNAGVFDKVNGIVLGHFYKCRNDNDLTDDNAYRVLQNFFKDFKIPVMYGLPYGHTPQHFCLPFGTKTTIDTIKRTIHIDGLSRKC